ncbi:MAG: amino acid permease, partial [Paenibacillus sp.]|nr:amino acid permease [Paenibacillus sp.]
MWAKTSRKRVIGHEHTWGMMSSFKRFLIGRPLKSEHLADEKLGKLKALAILSSDALSSVAYG